MTDLDNILSIYSQETEQLLADMESTLLSLESNPNDSETINCLFRAVHTIKGSSGLFGFNPIIRFTHEAETILDLVRNGERKIDSELISILLDCKDHTAHLIAFCLKYPEAELTDELNDIGNDLIKKLTGKSTTALEPSKPEIIELQSEGSNTFNTDDSWLIAIEFQENAFRNGMDPLSFIRYLQTIGEIKQILTEAPNLPKADNFDPESCYLHFKIAYKTDVNKETIESVFEFANEDSCLSILPPNSKVEEYQTLLQAQSEHSSAKLGEMLIDVGALTHKEVQQALQNQISQQTEHTELHPKPIGEILVSQNQVQQAVVDQALKIQDQNRQKLATDANHIRVDANKLGHLINLVGELVISSAAMSLIVERERLSVANDVAANMNTLVNSIRDTALELRMVQIGETFSRFRRVVRDVSKELEKEIELVINGGEAELDKTVVERINDPLTHLVRNALDHGIESPAERIAVGKPATGTLELNAFHQSGHIVLQISDDGAGLNSEKIAAKAIANGLIPANHDLSKQEIYNLIFSAGLSTKDQATNLSGRGVGMDVVKRNIEALRGNVSVETEEGQGTIISIELPLTLAIIDGFMVAIGEDRYIIPLSMVSECIEMENSECEEKNNQHFVNLRGEVLPYLRLSDYFQSNTHHTKKRESMVVVKFGQAKAGFVVDELLGEHQTVIKPLGKLFSQLKGITGATVLGDGNVALILDVQALIQATIKNKVSSSQTASLPKKTELNNINNNDNWQ